MDKSYSVETLDFYIDVIKIRVGETILQANRTLINVPIMLFSVGVFMAGLDNGIVSAALTTMYRSFEVSPAWGAWIVTLYTLGIAVSVPVIGKLSDNYGRKRLFLIEIALFAIGSFCVAQSTNFTFLLISRFIQAVGGGGIFILGSSYILATLPKKSQGKALGVLGGMQGIAAVIGPNVGAFILDVTGTWEWMFYINLPISICLFGLGSIYLVETKAPQNKRLDIKGAMLLSLSIIAFMLAITNIESTHLVKSLFHVQVLLFIVLGCVGIFLFIRHEKQLEAKHEDPLISYALLRNQTFCLILIIGFLSGAFLSTIIFIPSYVQQVLQIPAEQAGYWLTPLAISSGIGAGIGGILTDKIGAKRTVTLAGLIGFSGFYIFYGLETGLFVFVIASILAGIGLGFLLGAPVHVLIAENSRKNQYGASLGTLSLTRQIGLTLFPSIFGSFITTGIINIEPTVQSVYKEPIFQFEYLKGGESYDQIMQEIAKMDDPYLQNQLLDIIANVMRNGFQYMFLMALIISILIVMISIFIQIKSNSQNT